MGLKLYEETSVQAIADAIRAKNGSSDTYTISEMSTAIGDIPSGGGGSKYIMGIPMDLRKGSAMTVEVGFKFQATWNERSDDIVFQLCGLVDISSYKKLIVTGKTGDSYYHKRGEHDLRKIYIGTCDSSSSGVFNPTTITWNENPFIFTEVFSSFRAEIELDHSHDFVYFSAHGWTIEDLTFTLFEDEYSVYKYHWSNDGKICVREGLGEIKWFFNGLTFPDNSYDIAIPEELYDFLPSNDVSAREYPNDSSTTFTGYVAIGVSSSFSTPTFRNYDTGWNGYPGATVYAVIDINDGNAQETTYTDPLDIPDIDISLIEKTITENGTYSAEDDGYVGYSEVTVNVPPVGTIIPTITLESTITITTEVI